MADDKRDQAGNRTMQIDAIDPAMFEDIGDDDSYLNSWIFYGMVAAGYGFQCDD